ncbi:hypothetical protein AOLI_G00150030 [Acnodon oligacanthus]
MPPEIEEHSLQAVAHGRLGGGERPPYIDSNPFFSSLSLHLIASFPNIPPYPISLLVNPPPPPPHTHSDALLKPAGPCDHTQLEWLQCRDCLHCQRIPPEYQ